MNAIQFEFPAKAAAEIKASVKVGSLPGTRLWVEQTEAGLTEAR